MFVYGKAAYAKMRTFVTPDGKAGFALKDKDIVSVFNKPDSGYKGIGPEMVKLATEQGGDRLDAFDTVLPDIYSKADYRVASRLKFDPAEAPPGWKPELFKPFNDGKPDVVFMAHAPHEPGSYQRGEGPYADSFDQALHLQGELARKKRR